MAIAPPFLTFPTTIAVSVKDELERRFTFVVPRSVVTRFKKALDQRVLRLNAKLPIPAVYLSSLSAFFDAAPKSGTAAPDSASDEALAVALYFHLTQKLWENTVYHEVTRCDHEDFQNKKFSLVKFKDRIVDGCVGLVASIRDGQTHRSLYLLDADLLRVVWQQCAEAGAGSGVRLFSLSQRKIRTTDDAQGEWVISIDFSVPSSARKEKLEMSLTIKGRSCVEPSVIACTCTIPMAQQDPDDLPEFPEFGPYRVLRGRLGSDDPLPRDPQKIPLPAPVCGGPKLQPQHATAPPATVEVLGADPRYRVTPQAVSIVHGYSRDKGYFNLNCYLILHIVGRSFSAEHTDNNSLKRAPAAFCVGIAGERIQAIETSFGFLTNNDVAFPDVSEFPGNLRLSGDETDVMVSVRATFKIAGEAGRTNAERALVPPALPKPLELHCTLEEETSGVLYNIKMYKSNPPLQLPTLQSLLAEWEVPEFSLFLHADDVDHEERKYTACYVDPTDGFIIRQPGQKLFFQLSNLNYYSYRGMKENLKEIPLDDLTGTLKGWVLIDHSSFPPMAFAVKLRVTTPTSFAEGACHISFAGNDWIKTLALPSDSLRIAEEPATLPPHGTDATQAPSTETKAPVAPPVPTAPQPVAESKRTASNRFTVVYSDCIGSGAYGTVYKGFDNDTGQFVAVKECILSVERGDAAKVQRSIQDEYKTLTQLSHANIVRVLDLETVGPVVRIIMDWMASGSVSSILRQTHHRMHENIVRKFTFDALKGLAYLHSTGMLHLDIKPANLLVDANGSAKLADFGTSRIVGGTGTSVTTQRVVGTPAYMSPEMIHQGAAQPSCDIWALACSVCEMASGEMPWVHLDPSVRQAHVPLMFHIGTAKPPDHHPVIPAHLSSQLKAILEKCFAYVPSARPSAETLLRDPYFVHPNLPDDAESYEHFRATVVSDVNSGSASSWDDASIERSYGSTIQTTS